MKRILYSGMGTTDPVRGMRDGGMIHILRHYRPDIVYLFLTQEVVQMDRRDGRVQKTFDFLKNNWDGYEPEVVPFETEIDDPSDMDALTEPMETLLQQILQEHPESEIILNLSSGTPQMQIILAQMALDSRYRTRGVQVKSPERQSGTAERTNGCYPVEEALELNEDEEEGAPDRCCEPQMLAVRREAVRNQLNALLSRRNYMAISEMGNELPAPIPKLAKHLGLRSQFRLKEAEEAASGLSKTGLRLYAGKEDLSYPDYELVEYFGCLKNMAHLGQYTDLVIRLNPFVIRLQIEMLDGQLRQRGGSRQDILEKRGGKLVIAPEKIEKRIPELADFCQKNGAEKLEGREPSLWVMNVMLRYFLGETEEVKLLMDCERLNRQLRNSVAHELSSVTEQQIWEISGRDTQMLLRSLERLLLKTLEKYDSDKLKKRLNVYDRCDEWIRRRY